MTTSNKPPDIPIDKAVRILDAIERQLENRFQEIYDEKYNPNTKGFDYERILGKFLNGYLGGAFNFPIRVGIMDNELRVNSVLKETENEFDIVATYKDAAPRLVHNRLIPYDSIAFVIEAKQTLKLSEKEDEGILRDLGKFDKLNKLQVVDYRISGNPAVSNPYRIRRPLRILFCYEKEADNEKLREILETRFREAWDICIIQKEKTVILNSTLPYVRLRVRERYPNAIIAEVRDYPLLKGMFFACAFIEGNFVNSWTLFANLFRVLEQTQGNKETH